MKKIARIGLFIPALLVTLSCSGNESETPRGKTLVSTLAGNYSSIEGQGNGVVSNWKLYSDDTFTGTWTSAAGAVSLACSGTYSLSGTAITWSATGTATNANLAPATSPFSGTGSGTLDSTNGNGTYSITFSAWNTADSGIWNVTKE